MNDNRQRLINFTQKAYFPFLALFLISGLISILALRHNNTTMITLREDVYQADKDNGDVNGALQKLRSYVYGHMNTSLSGSSGIKPPIQLSYTYARLQAGQEQNADLYIEAKNYCEAQIPANVSISGRGRIQCITEYVTSHGAKPVNVPAGLYEFDFLSPSWSPDLAGWSLVATMVFLALFLISFLQSFVARRHYLKYIK